MEAPEIEKVYFTRSEAMQILDFTRSWLECRWRLLGFNGGRTHRRYSVDELNLLIAERQKSRGFDRTTYMREYMAKYREMGKGRYVSKNNAKTLDTK